MLKSICKKILCILYQINCNILEITRNKNKCLIIFVIYIDQKIIVKKAVTAIKKTFVHMSTSDSKN